MQQRLYHSLYGVRSGSRVLTLMVVCAHTPHSRIAPSEGFQLLVVICMCAARVCFTSISRRGSAAWGLSAVRTQRWCRDVATSGIKRTHVIQGQPSTRRLPPLGVLWRHSSSSPQHCLDDVIITNACARRIKALREKSNNPELKLRLAVEGGGCSGFQYTFTMDGDPLNEDDRVFEREGAKVVVDEGSLELVKGATVEFVDEMMRSAFAVVNNPQSESACGCGSSFAVRAFSSNPAKD